MDARRTWGGNVSLDNALAAIGAWFQGAGPYIFLISFTGVYYLSNASLLLAHYDLGWHLAAGDFIREHGQVPVLDPFSFTAGGRQWFNLSWLSDVIASVIFHYAGFAGLVLSVAACAALIVFYMATTGLRSGASVAAVSISVFFACLLYPSFATAPNIYLAASPNTFTMLFCVVFYGECLRRTHWFLLPVLMVLWANLHGGFVLGFLIIGVFGVAALLRRDGAGFRAYGFAGIACLVAILITPLGLHIYDGVAATLGHFVQAYITEWMSYSQNISDAGAIPGIAYILTFVALELRGKGSYRLEPRLLSWLFLVLGLHQFRYMSFFFIFSAVPMALHIDRLLPRWLTIPDAQRSLLAAGIIGLCALPLTFLHMAPTLGLAQLLAPRDAEYLQNHFPQARLLNHWNVGGNLIFFTRGAIPVFVDGRAATAYPDTLLRDYFSLAELEVDEAAWDRVLAKYRIDTVLWVRAHEQLRRFLVDRRGWKEAYAGSYQSIYIRP
jgi:hypothetical protein